MIKQRDTPVRNFSYSQFVNVEPKMTYDIALIVWLISTEHLSPWIAS